MSCPACYAVRANINTDNAVCLAHSPCVAAMVDAWNSATVRMAKAAAELTDLHMRYAPQEECERARAEVDAWERRVTAYARALDSLAHAN